MFTPDHISLFQIIEEVAKKRSVSAFIVGGVIRDIFLGVDPGDKDIDFIIEGDAKAFAAQCVPYLEGSLKTFESFGTAKILSPKRLPTVAEVDFASSREEIYERPGALPTVKCAAIGDDLKRRDFTINALAVEVSVLREWGVLHFGDLEWLSSNVLDYYDGLSDLRQRRVRVLQSESFLDDPTRLFRGCRYCVRIGGAFDSETEQLALKAVRGGALATVSKGRIANELRKVLEEKEASAVWKALSRLEVLQNILPLSVEALNEGVGRLSRLDQVQGALAAPLKYQVALRVFLDLVNQSGGEELFGDYGLGKKEIRRFHRERTQIQQARDDTSYATLKSETLLFSYITESVSDPAVKRELVSRGMIA